jgi:hypothetical protein
MKWKNRFQAFAFKRNLYPYTQAHNGKLQETLDALEAELKEKSRTIEKYESEIKRRNDEIEKKTKVRSCTSCMQLNPKCHAQMLAKVPKILPKSPKSHSDAGESAQNTAKVPKKLCLPIRQCLHMHIVYAYFSVDA